MPFQMRRTALPKLKVNEKTWENPSLLFDKGFEEWDTDSTARGKAISNHIEAVCEVAVPKVYTAAYQRWLAMTSDADDLTRWFGKLAGRLFIGLGMAHVLEAQVCRHPVYGMPYIPGSALKGLARAKAREYAKKQEKQEEFNKVLDILFGPELTDSKDSKAEAGYLIFHDTWWIPEEVGGSKKQPYVQEVVTVHAVEYYKNQGKDAPHPDMESPNPNQQLAVHGSFYFVVEGKQQWAKLGMKFLTLALEGDGIGGKVAAGYGYFQWDEEAFEKSTALAQRINKKRQQDVEARRKQLDAAKKAKERKEMLPEDGLVYDLEQAISKYNAFLSSQTELDSIRSLVKTILSSSGWSKTHKEKAFEVIERACPIVFKKDKLKKKVGQAKKWLKGEFIK